MNFPIIAVPVVLLALLGTAHADDWQVCRLEVTIIETVKTPYPALKGQVKSVTPKPADTECPQRGETIQFKPESPDWQREVPRKKWPKPGQLVKMRYQYLDGTCMGDGNDHPCRIKHYPMGW